MFGDDIEIPNTVNPFKRKEAGDTPLFCISRAVIQNDTMIKKTVWCIPRIQNNLNREHECIKTISSSALFSIGQ